MRESWPLTLDNVPENQKNKTIYKHLSNDTFGNWSNFYKTTGHSFEESIKMVFQISLICNVTVFLYIFYIVYIVYNIIHYVYNVCINIKPIG